MDVVRTQIQANHVFVFLQRTTNNTFLFPITLTFPNPSTTFHRPLLRLSLRSPSTDHSTLLLDTYSDHRSFKTLLKRLSRPNSCPLSLLAEEGDWTKEHFWAVVRFLEKTSRAPEIPLVFYAWKRIEKSRINERNYGKIIKVLAEEGLMEEAVVSFEEMKGFGLCLSLEVYNPVIHGFAQKGKFEDALFYLEEMKDVDVSPESETFDGLIEAYAKYKKYDEIEMCLKKMRLNDCPPDHITYNLLMKEYSRGGLLKRMESTYHTMISKRMFLKPSTLLVMLDTYAKFGILDKMEKFYTRVLSLKIRLGDDLIRKLAEVYIDNYMFSKLEKLGHELSSVFGESDLFWCLRLLSHACVLSRKGMDSVLEDMEESQIPWNTTIANIICLTHLKMKDFTHLRITLSQITHLVEPDMITVGILFDAIDNGFDGTEILRTWNKMDFFYKAAEINTDPLVLIAFGKGQFLRNCEAAFSSLKIESRDQKTWNYHNLVELVFRHKGS